MVLFTFAMRGHLIRLASAPISSFRLAKFGWVPFADFCVQRLATKQNAEFKVCARKLRCYFKLIRLWTKVHEILEQCMRSLLLPTPLLYCLRHISFRRYILKSLKYRTNVKVLAPFFGRNDPDFSTAHCLRDVLSTVWQSSVEFRLLISVCEAWQ